ncbi:hypothetical protein [Microbacterium sp. NPDC058389]|uniref:hypothetical protein n=1 Tax=Microbacterium sp. NPDC058389 TaxID=3346475 RepID=UPI00365882AD
MSKTLKTIGSVVAPITLITALMFYFGLQHAHSYFHYFGVNHTVMGLTTQDYLIRSADGLFVPLTVLAAAVLLSLWTLRLVTGLVPAEKKAAAYRIGALFAVLLGASAATIAIIGLLQPTRFERASAVPGLSLCAGVLLLALASNLYSRGGSARRSATAGWVGIVEWGALFVAVSIGLFWSVTNYSASVGELRAFRTADELEKQPDVLLYSRDRLSVPGATAHERACSPPESSELSYRYRYERLKLVLASDQSYLLLPTNWPAGGGIAIVLPRTESVRLEFMRPDMRQATTC